MTIEKTMGKVERSNMGWQRKNGPRYNPTEALDRGEEGWRRLCHIVVVQPGE
jgi:hypothetical protein